MNTNELRKLIEISEKYNGANCNVFAGAGHDEIWFNLPEQDDISDEDKAILDEIGLFWSEDYDCWTKFV